jgi:hypothetical protein
LRTASASSSSLASGASCPFASRIFADLTASGMSPADIACRSARAASTSLFGESASAAA